MFSVVQRAGYDAVGFMLDCPPPEAADDSAYVSVVEEFAAALPGGASRGAVICSLPESLSRCDARAVPRRGHRAAAGPARSARGARSGRRGRGALGARRAGRAARSARARGGWRTPSPNTRARARSPPSACPCRARRSSRCATSPTRPPALGFPVVIKAAARGARAQIRGRRGDPRTCAPPEDAAAAAQRLARLSDTLLVEEMISDGVAEILVGISRRSAVRSDAGARCRRRADRTAARQREPAAALQRSRDRGRARAAARVAPAAGLSRPAAPPTCRRWSTRSSPARATRRPTSSGSRNWT